ncbi:MAG: PLP-dependent aminotransferase family protein [Clostridiales Family XIII bacterium]|nr:PLP-dependent aminotransferase family protein [Clostridiales Family XIII bacterium]
MNIEITKGNQTPVFRQAANQIKAAILSGELKEGLFLPSEREMAGMMGVHRNTVTRVYQELGCEGYLEPVRGRGHRVSFREGNETSDFLPAFARSGATSGGTHAGRYPGVPWFALMRDGLADRNAAFDDPVSDSCTARDIPFAAGVAPPEARFEEDIRRIFLDLLTSGDEGIFARSHYQGLYALRAGLCAMLRMKGVDAAPSEIQIVSETNQALSCLAELFTERGDTIIVEEPTSPDIYRTFLLRGASVLSVPSERDGMDLNMLETLLKRRRPKFICVSSAFHDPTGVSMSVEKRRRLLELSYRYVIPIIEEDSSSELFFTEDRAPCIKSMDENGNVIYIRSFALTFAPGLKMAFVLGNRQVVRKLGRLQSIHATNPDSINQSVIDQCIKKGLYMKHAGDIRRCCKAKRDLFCDCLAEARRLGLRFDVPRGGVYLWCRLPEGLDHRKFRGALARRGVRVTPGALFFPNGTTGEDYIRLNYSLPSKEQIETGAGILTETLRALMR